MKVLLNLATPHTALALTIGWSFLSTGGGNRPSDLLAFFSKLHEQDRTLMVESLEGFQETDLVATVYGVGPAGGGAGSIEEAIRSALGLWERVSGGRTIAAFFPAETNSIRSFEAAAMAGVRCLDADATGGRAVPFMEADNFILAGRGTWPLVAATPDGSSLLLDSISDPMQLDALVRELAKGSPSGRAIVLDHIVPVSEARELLTLGVVQLGVTLGNTIQAAANLESLTQQLHTLADAELLGHGVVSAVDLRVRDGFLKGVYRISTSSKELLVAVQNENIALWEMTRGNSEQRDSIESGSLRLHSSPQITTPDRLCALDSRSRMGIHNAELSVGQEIMLFHIPAEDRWRGPLALKLFGPGRFSFPDLMNSLSV